MKKFKLIVSRLGIALLALALLSLSLPLAAEKSIRVAASKSVPQQAWQRLLWAEHLASVTDARKVVKQWLINTDLSSFAKDEVALLRTLFDAKTLPIRVSDLAGNWRVRSLQATTDGLYIYPFFKAEIALNGERIQLRKTSGSQRRLGLLYLDREAPNTLVFLGGSSVNDELQTGYSRGFSKVDAPEPSESDSVGVLYRIGESRLLMILDARQDDGFELYELVRR